MPLPHVVPFSRTPVYFFTACIAGRRTALANACAHDLLRGIWERSASLDGWFVGRYVLMPDHAHLFASPAPTAKSRAAWQKTWRSISSRHLAANLQLTQPVWQEDVFDHIMRSRESYAEKWGYVRNNPVRAGLVTRPEDWPWQGEIHRLEVR